MNNLFERVNRKFKAYFMITIAALIYTFALQSFLIPAKLFASGLGAFANLLTYAVHALAKYYSLLYLALNIPLIIIFYKKLKKSFLYRTIFFLIVQAGIGSLFLIRDIHDYMTNIFDSLEPFRTDNGTERATVWPVIVMALIAAVLCGISIAITWKYGGSSAGADIVVYYFSTKSKKPVGKIMTIISFAIVTLSFSISEATDSDSNKFWYIWLLATIGYILLQNSIVNKIYPKYAKVNIAIHSNKIEEIKMFLKKPENFDHAFIISEATSGYNGNKKLIIRSVVLLLETKQLKKKLQNIDPNLWMSITKVREVFGNFSFAKAEE